MGVISTINFLVLADAIAAQAQQLATTMGDGSAPLSPVTASDSAAANIDRVNAETDAEIVGELINGFRNQFEKMTTNPNAYDRYFASVQALNIHVGGMNAFMTAAGERVAPEFKACMESNIAEKFDPENTFSPVVPDMGTIDILGAASGTFTNGDTIDIENYFAANLRLRKTTVAAAADAIMLRVHLKDWDDNDVTKDVAVDASDVVDTLYDIGLPAPSPDKYWDVTNIEVLSGGAVGIGEQWQVESILERVVTL